MSCQLCLHGANNFGGQVRCQCVESDYFDKLMDCADSCRWFKQKKTMFIKEKPPIEKVEHIKLDLSMYNKSKEPVKKLVEKEKNYKIKAGKKNNTIYVIVCEDHVANFGDNEFGGKHIYFHEEIKAKSFCKRKSYKKIKYKYIECKILNEL